MIILACIQTGVGYTDSDSESAHFWLRKSQVFCVWSWWGSNFGSSNHLLFSLPCRDCMRHFSVFETQSQSQPVSVVWWNCLQPKNWVKHVIWTHRAYEVPTPPPKKKFQNYLVVMSADARKNHKQKCVNHDGCWFTSAWRTYFSVCYCYEYMTSSMAGCVGQTRTTAWDGRHLALLVTMARKTWVSDSLTQYMTASVTVSITSV